jgi:hypothetical protein
MSELLILSQRASPHCSLTMPNTETLTAAVKITATTTSNQATIKLAPEQTMPVSGKKNRKNHRGSGSKKKDQAPGASTEVRTGTTREPNATTNEVATQGSTTQVKTLTTTQKRRARKTKNKKAKANPPADNLTDQQLNFEPQESPDTTNMQLHATTKEVDKYENTPLANHKDNMPEKSEPAANSEIATTSSTDSVSDVQESATESTVMASSNSDSSTSDLGLLSDSSDPLMDKLDRLSGFPDVPFEPNTSTSSHARIAPDSAGQGVSTYDWDFSDQSLADNDLVHFTTTPIPPVVSGQNLVHNNMAQTTAPPVAVMTSFNGLYQVRPVPGKGMGMFAARDIAKGTRILRESPMYVLRKEKDGSSDLHQVPLAYQRFSPQDKALYLTLAHTPNPVRDAEIAKIIKDLRSKYPDKVSTLSVRHQLEVMSILETNSFEITEGGAMFGSAVIPEASRMNHSCTPNVYHCWNETINQLTVHAIRDIKAGEEILTCYINVCGKTTDRQSKLARWGFTCDCAACDQSTPYGQASELRRTRLCDVNRMIFASDSSSNRIQQISDDERLDCELEVMELLMREGLVNPALGIK